MKGKKLILAAMFLMLGAVCLATPGKVRKVGQPEAFVNTRAMVNVNGKLYSIESNREFFLIDPKTGAKKKISDLDVSTRRSDREELRVWQICILGDKIYMIIGGGTLYRINPADGSCVLVGKEGVWENTRRITSLNGKLYSVEGSGALYVTDPDTLQSKQISDYTFLETRAMFVAKGKLYIVWMDKELTVVNPENASYTRIGRQDDWENFRSVFVSNDKIYFVMPGNGKPQDEIFEVDSDTGQHKSLGEIVFPDDVSRPAYMAMLGNNIYATDALGKLYEVSAK